MWCASGLSLNCNRKGPFKFSYVEPQKFELEANLEYVLTLIFRCRVTCHDLVVRFSVVSRTSPQTWGVRPGQRHCAHTPGPGNTYSRTWSNTPVPWDWTGGTWSLSRWDQVLDTVFCPLYRSYGMPFWTIHRSRGLVTRSLSMPYSQVQRIGYQSSHHAAPAVPQCVTMYCHSNIQCSKKEKKSSFENCQTTYRYWNHVMCLTCEDMSHLVHWLLYHSEQQAANEGIQQVTHKSSPLYVASINWELELASCYVRSPYFMDIPISFRRGVVTYYISTLSIWI